MRRAMRRCAACMLAAASAAGGCANDGATAGGDKTVVQRGGAPDYYSVATRYNERVDRLGSVWASTVVRFTYRDSEGEQKTDQGEGTLQVVRPDDLALSIKKAGKRLFWFGCDAERYWWFDLVDRHIASVGRHDRFDEAKESGIGLAMRPRDVILVLGVMPLPMPEGDQAVDAATQWSLDGRLLGVTTRVGGSGGAGSGLLRLWLDPASLEPAKAEVFDEQKRLVMVADLTEYQYVRVTGIGGGGPRMPGRISAWHAPSQTLIKLDLADLQDGAEKISPSAFDFEELCRALGAETTIDLDAGQ